MAQTTKSGSSNDGEENGTTASSDEQKQMSMTEYCQSLETWLGNVYMQRNCAISAYFTAYSLVFGNNSQAFSTLTRNGSGLTSPTTGAAQNRQHNPVIEFVHNAFRVETLQIAPVWKRLMAEAFDFAILLMVKVFVTISIIDKFQFIDLDSIELDVLQDSGSIYEIAIALTTELIILELIHRVIVCFFEAYWLSKSGCTPGKSLMRLRVVHCETMQEVNNRLIISPGTTLSFPRALLRSALKNFSMALFFPMCFPLIHFENNQTLYDCISRSVVVSY